MPRGILSNNLRPVALLRSWLRALNIPYSEGLASPTDLVVGDPPKTLCVHVTTGPQDQCPGLQEPPGVNLNGAAICYGGQEAALQEFWHLLEVMDIRGRPVPFHRGPPLKDKARRCLGEEDLVLFRHDKFRMAPNPSHEQIEAYKNVVGMAAKIFWKRNRALLQSLQVDYGEVEAYMWVWATTYMAHYELPGGPEENQKLMLTFLQQQSWELRNSYRRKAEEYQKAHILAAEPLNTGCRRRGRGGGTVFLFTHQEEADAMVTTLDMRHPPEVLLRDRELEVETHRAHLLERLQELPHDEMLRRLRAAAGATMVLQKDARQRALKLLQEHQHGCRTCLHHRQGGSDNPLELSLKAGSM